MKKNKNIFCVVSFSATMKLLLPRSVDRLVILRNKTWQFILNWSKAHTLVRSYFYSTIEPGSHREPGVAQGKFHCEPMCLCDSVVQKN